MKNQSLQLFRSLVMVFGIMLSCIHAKSQTPSDFWAAFEACSQVTAFQSHYPNLSANQTRTHAVMNHGVTIPTTQGVTFSQIAVELYDKSTMLGMEKTHFFIFHDVKIEGNQAMFDVVYYYNFNGSYDQFVAATIKLTKTNGVWAVTETKIN